MRINPVIRIQATKEVSAPAPGVGQTDIFKVSLGDMGWGGANAAGPQQDGTQILNQRFLIPKKATGQYRENT